MTISGCKGKLQEMLKNSKFEIVLVNKKSGTGMEAVAEAKSANYS